MQAGAEGRRRRTPRDRAGAEGSAAARPVEQRRRAPSSIRPASAGRGHGTPDGRPGTPRRSARSPRARSSRSRRPAGRRAGPPRPPTPAAGAAGGQSRQVGLGPPPADVGIPAQRPETRARRIDERRHRRRAGTAARLAQVRADHADARRAARGNGLPRAARLAGDGRRRRRSARDRPCPPPSRWSCRPAPRSSRAPARPAAPPPRRQTSCEASSCTTNAPGRGQRRPQRIALDHDQAVGRETRRADHDAGGRQVLRPGSRRVTRRLTRSVRRPARC